jgi:hypothetical protein
VQSTVGVGTTISVSLQAAPDGGRRVVADPEVSGAAPRSL